MATTLPSLNNTTPLKKDSLIAVIDDDSIKKITTKISKSFSNVTQNYSAKIVSKMTQGLSDKLNVFGSVENILKEISAGILKTHELFEERFKKEDVENSKREFNDAEDKMEESEKKDNKKPKLQNDEKETSEKLKNLVDKMKAGFGDLITNPGIIGKKLVIGFLEYSGLRRLMKIFNPANILRSGKRLIAPRAALGTAGALMAGDEAITAFGEATDYATKTNNSDVAAGLARFMAGPGGKGLVNKFSHYGAFAATGAQVGLMTGGPIGMLAGGLIGAGLAALTDYLGANWFADKLQLIGDKLSSVMAIFDPKKINTKKVEEQIAKGNETIQKDLELIETNNVQLAALQKQLLDAQKAGDDGLAEKLQTRIDNLKSSNANLQSDIDGETAKIKAKKEELDIAATKGWTSRVLKFMENNIGYLSPLYIASQNIPDSLKRATADVYDKITKIGGNIADGIIDIAKKLKDSFLNVFKNLPKLFADKLKSLAGLGENVPGITVDTPLGVPTIAAPTPPVSSQLVIVPKKARNEEIRKRARDANMGQKFPTIIAPNAPTINRTNNNVSTNIQNSYPTKPNSYDSNFSGFLYGE